MRETGPLEPAVAIDVVEQILRAAQFAHRRGVIHRDLKPHNVILDEEGRARVTDFGIARAGASDMTLTGSIMGTAQYLSPEQAQGYAVSSASDIYSVGVILYELLTGVVPFEGETAVAIAFKQVAAAPRPPSEINPALPPSLDAVVLRALAKEPSERYADAAELIAALERERHALPAYTGAALIGGPVPDGASQPTGVLTPAPFAGGLMMPSAERLADEHEGGEDGRRRLRRPLLYGGLALLVAALAAAAVFLIPASSKPTVPSVVGESEQVAAAKLREASLVPSSQVATSASVATGLVISQSPAAGATVKKNTVVTIIVSSGPASVKLEDVEGQSEKVALERLRKAGFKPKPKTEASTSIAAGQRDRDRPARGDGTAHGQPRHGDRLERPRARARSRRGRPDAGGRRIHPAERRARRRGHHAAGLLAEPRHGAGAIARARDPPARRPVGGAHRGEGVRSGDRPERGRQERGARRGGARRGGLHAETRTQPTTEAAQVGIVLSQKPVAGHKARKGATVVITVGVASTPTTPSTTPTTTPATTPAGPAPGPGP